MPDYEFGCLKSGKKLTLALTVSQYDKGKRKRTGCGSTKLERLISSVTVQTSRKS